MKFCDEQINLILHLISYIQNDKGQAQRYMKIMFGKEYSEKEIKDLLGKLRQELKIQGYK